MAKGGVRNGESSIECGTRKRQPGLHVDWLSSVTEHFPATDSVMRDLTSLQHVMVMNNHWLWPVLDVLRVVSNY